MLRHMVLFGLKPEVETKERDALFEQIEKLSDIDSVRRLAIGSLLDPTDPAYRDHMSRDYQYALLIEFDDEAGLYAYQKEPYHVGVGKEIRKHVSAITVMDFLTSE
jgi:hypothetical protein